MYYALQCIEQIYKKQNKELIVTSALDGKHAIDSLHYSGKAVDIRIRNLKTPINVYNKIITILSDDFDVLLYSTHIHIEYQPKNIKRG